MYCYKHFLTRQNMKWDKLQMEVEVATQSTHSEFCMNEKKTQSSCCSAPTSKMQLLLLFLIEKKQLKLRHRLFKIICTKSQLHHFRRNSLKWITVKLSLSHWNWGILCYLSLVKFRIGITNGFSFLWIFLFIVRFFSRCIRSNRRGSNL